MPTIENPSDGDMIRLHLSILISTINTNSPLDEIVSAAADFVTVYEIYGDNRN